MVFVIKTGAGPLIIPVHSDEAGGPDNTVSIITTSDLTYSVSAGNLQSVPEGATITITPIVYTISVDGVESTYTPAEGELTRQWFDDGVAVSGETGLTYVAQVGDTSLTFQEVLNAAGFDPIDSSTSPIAVQATAPLPDVPPTPAPEDWAPYAGEFEPPTQADEFRVNVAISNDLTVYGAQWTTGTLDSHWETLAPISDPYLPTTPGVTWYETRMLNPIIDRDWSLFRVSEPVRLGNLAIRYQNQEGGSWSERSAKKTIPTPAAPGSPGAPTLVSASPGALDGQVNLAATAPADWGDGAAAGTVQYSTSTSGPWADIAATVTVSASLWGTTATVYFTALNSLGLRSELVSDTVAVPGTSSGWPHGNLWARWTHVRDETVAQNANGFTSGEGRVDVGLPHQFCEGGDRSKVDDSVAIMIEDVHGAGWITENANDDWPVWRSCRAGGLQGRDAVSAMFDPDIRNRIVLAISEGGNTSNQGHGIFVSENLGNTFERKLATFIPDSGTNNRIWRTHRRLFGYKPGNHDHWIFVNPWHNIWNSTNRGESWTNVSNFPTSANMGRCWDVHVSKSNNSHVWMACETGLWRSTNFGATVSKMAATGLATGKVTSMAFHPTDLDKFWVCVYGKGLFVTTNYGVSFSRVTVNNNSVGQVAVCQSNPNHIWITGIWLDDTGAKPNSPSQYSSNGGASWLNFINDVSANGWPGEFDDNTWLRDFKINGRDQMSMQSIICPSEDNPGEAIGTAQTQMWRINGRNAYAASSGFDTLAYGEADDHNIAWHPDPAKSDWVAVASFDKVLFASQDGGFGWKKIPSASNGYSGLPNCHSSTSINKSNNDIMFSSGFYHGLKRIIIVKNWGNGGSFRPAFFNTNQREYFCAYATDNPQWAYSTSGISDDYGATWQTWQSRGTGFTPMSSGSYNGVISVSPSDSTVLWGVAGQKLYRTTNRGLSWAEVVAALGVEVRDPQPTSFCPHPTDPDSMFWWSRGNGLRRWKSGVGVTTYSSIGVNTGHRIHRIRIDHSDPDIMYLFARNDSARMRAIPGASMTHVFRSVAGPAGPFVDITTNLPRSVANMSLEIDPHTGKVIVCGTAGERFLPPPYAVDPNDAALALRNGT